MSSRNMQDIKTQIELLETKKITTCKMKNTLDRIDGSSDNIGGKKKIGEHEDTAIEIIPNKTQREKA